MGNCLLVTAELHKESLNRCILSRFMFWFMSCLVISCLILKCTNFPSRFRYLALPPVSSVWLSSMIPKVFPPVPLGPSCAQIVCVSLCPVPVCWVLLWPSRLAFWSTAIDSSSLQSSDPPAERILCLVIYSLAIVNLITVSFTAWFCSSVFWRVLIC